MLKIRYAKGLIDKLEYSSYDDYETYPASKFVCENCGEKVGFALGDLEKHRFSRFSNLKMSDTKKMDRLMLSMIPKQKLVLKRQLLTLSEHERKVVMLQRIYLRITGYFGDFLPIPSAKDDVPDSFLDYYCMSCHKPIRIYYASYLGGRQCETGYVIKYVLN